MDVIYSNNVLRDTPFIRYDDAQSRRISKQLDSTSATYYLYDGWNMIAEYTIPSSNMDPNTTILIGNTYTWGMDLSGSMQGAGGVGGLLAVTENGSSSTAHFYPTYDGNGNVSEYLDANGSAVAHYEYDTFGNEIVSATTGSLAQNFEYRFSTKYLDEESGFYYYGYRYYDPSTGRWPSRDPIEETGGFNLYGFGFNNATNGYDVLGQKVCIKKRIDKTIFNKTLVKLPKFSVNLEAQVRGTFEICDNGEKTLTAELVGAAKGTFPLPIAILTGVWSVEVHGKVNATWCDGFQGGDAELDVTGWIGAELGGSGVATISGEIGLSTSWTIAVDGDEQSLDLDATGKEIWLNGRIKAKLKFARKRVSP